MFRMLIVDDEPEIVDSIFELFTERAISELEVMRAYSSKDAILYLNSMKIDVLLTDIRMPGTNGLQLASHARTNWPKCRTIFLTGHNEFDYAYSAIKESC